MSNTRRILPLVFLAIISGKGLSQKEYDFAAAGQAKTLINPAFTGNNEGLLQELHGMADFRLAYPSFQNYLLVDLPILRAKKSTNGGLSIAHTKHDLGKGMYISRQIDVSYSYAIRLGKWGFTPAVQVSHLYRRLNMNKVSFGQAMPYGFNFNEPVPEHEKQNISFSGGMIFNLGNKLTIGAAFYDLNNPNIGLRGDFPSGIRHSYHASGLLKVGSLFRLQPYAHVRIGGYMREEYADAGLFIGIKFFTLQTAMRNAMTINRKNSRYAIIGASCYFLGVKFGYTANFYSEGYHANEIFLALNFSNLKRRDKTPFQPMMINVPEMNPE